MKKILYSLTAAALMCSLSACNALDSLLEEVNYGNPTIEDMVSNEANVVMQVGQIYANVKYTLSLIHISEPTRPY